VLGLEFTAFARLCHGQFVSNRAKDSDYLNLLRESVKKPLWVSHAEAHAFLREAEALLKKPAPGTED